MIVVTGAAGFIGSCLVGKMNTKGFGDITIVDDFSNPQKNLNLKSKPYRQQVHRDKFIMWLRDNHSSVDHIFHIGARTDTTEFNVEIFNRLNLNYSKDIWNACTEYQIPLTYASSAATYGMGEFGYIDDHEIIKKLKPLNPYGESKNEFDKWVLQQENLGTGMARSFFDLATATFKALNLEPDISFIDTPIDIREKYQYFTQANIKKLRASGFNQSFYTLEAGITEYVQGYLARNSYY